MNSGARQADIHVGAVGRMSLVENLVFGRALADTPKLVPGLILALLVVVVSVLLADYVNSRLGYNGLLSYIMTAIMIGLLAGNVAAIPSSFAPGISFCLTKLLRLGIIMIGIRLSIFDAARIGAWGIPIVVICVLTGLVLTTYFTRMLRLPDRLGTLMAVGTSICGATAIVATAPAIGAKDQEVAYAVANITVFGIIAMLVYPYLANVLFAGNVVMVGLFLGTAIHETAQVTGGALIYDQVFNVTAKPSAADIAIVIKLVRNVFIAAVIPLMAYVYARRMTSQGGTAGTRVSVWKLFPIFILGFIAMTIFRSLGDAGFRHGGLAFGLWAKADWSRGIALISDGAGYALAMAMAGVGLGTHLKTLKGLGIKPFFVGLFAALVVGVASALAVFLLGRFVQI
jgi:uncharacterized integral membrane protein (TIGR00698 family)